jgi:hypothetical protein
MIFTAAINLMMEAVSTFGTFANFYETIRRNIPEDSYLHIYLSFIYPTEETSLRKHDRKIKRR